MKLRDYIDSLTKEDQDTYAKACGTTGDYLRVHIRYGRKECRKELREALADNSGGKVSRMEVLEHFGIVPVSEPPAAA